MVKIVAMCYCYLYECMKKILKYVISVLSSVKNYTINQIFKMSVIHVDLSIEPHNNLMDRSLRAAVFGINDIY